MTIKTTRWRPDTCDCIIDYEWDTDVRSADRVHTFKTAVNIGPEHAGLVGAALYAEVTSENSRKNMAQGIAQAISVSLTPDIYRWAFDVNRVLEVSFLINISTTAKKQIQDACDIQFGPGKVVVL